MKTSQRNTPCIAMQQPPAPQPQPPIPLNDDLASHPASMPPDFPRFKGTQSEDTAGKLGECEVSNSFPLNLDGWDVYDASNDNLWVRGKVLKSGVKNGVMSYFVKFYGYSSANNKWLDRRSIFPSFKIKVGDRILAFWQGRRDKAFKGKVVGKRKSTKMQGETSNFRGRFFYDVDFDDGDKERNIPEDCVFPEDVRIFFYKYAINLDKPTCFSNPFVHFSILFIDICNRFVNHVSIISLLIKCVPPTT